MAAVQRRRLGEILVAQGLIDEFQLSSAVGHQRQWGGKLGSALVELGFVSEAAIAQVLEGQLRQKCLSEDAMRPEPDALKLVSMEDAARQLILPLKLSGNELTLAMSNPLDLALLDELQFRLGKRIRGVLAVESAVKRAIKRYYSGGGGRDYRPVAVTEPAASLPLAGNGARFADSPADSLIRAAVTLLVEKGLITEEELKNKLKSKNT